MQHFKLKSLTEQQKEIYDFQSVVSETILKIVVFRTSYIDEQRFYFVYFLLTKKKL